MIKQKLLQRLLGGRSDANIRFSELRNLLRSFGFVERTQGSHHIYVKEGVEDMINLQREGSKAKPYQVRQVRRVLVRSGLGDIDDA